MTHIYLDIETRATQRADIRERVAAGVKPPANYKSAEAIAKWWLESGNGQREESISRTALDGTWGEVLCIGWAIDDGPVNVTTGPTEAALLSDWAAHLRLTMNRNDDPSHYDWERRVIWVGHNVQDFDLRFLWQRTRVNEVKLHFPLPMERYPRGPHIYDTMKEWSGFGKYVKQSDLEIAFGLDRTDPLSSGAEVATASLSDTIAHCAEDVRLLREIHRRMVA